MLTQLKDIEHHEATEELQQKISQIENEARAIVNPEQNNGLDVIKIIIIIAII